ncbi:hypothetical protein PC129_g1969 [Phytophthora cactorum]|uniref:Uncharacterized protein n=1 Tax=Phytophthora cactorum TaxID=29920 RepID=A0A8T1IQS3_9STRA|nr:hypothetical protein PC113_g5650 [Phytophthora cactorum]KAG3071984.1 hypothetical protein PC121_g9076 [Phytophthora cactorum]KAG3227464.1 hypothetical protein PC129_g1969 [Phytophthora cactorum]
MQSTPTPTSDASTDRSQSPEHHAVKKRKPTYLIRKEEEKALRDEVLKLEAQVASLQTKRIPVAASMQQVAAESKVLREVTRNQQLGVAAAQSLVLECAWTQYSHPLCPTIATFAMSDDSTACWSPAQPTAKKRKPTYLVRKEEEQSLKDEILQLQAKVAVLKTQGMPTGSAIAADPSLQESTAKWKVLTNTIKNQQLGVAEAQSLAMECTRTQYSHPLHSRIRLKKNWVMIKAMREILYTHGRDDCRLSLAQTNQLDLFPFAGRGKDSER